MSELSPLDGNSISAPVYEGEIQFAADADFASTLAHKKVAHEISAFIQNFETPSIVHVGGSEIKFAFGSCNARVIHLATLIKITTSKPVIFFS